MTAARPPVKAALMAAALLAQVGIILWVAPPKQAASVAGLPAGARPPLPLAARSRSTAVAQAAEPAKVSSDLVLDARANPAQLVRGFFPHERSASQEQPDWRWTERLFVVALPTPAGAADRAAVVRLEAAAVAPMLQTGPIKISAKLDEQLLGSASLDKPGRHHFEFQIPAAQLKAPSVNIAFEVDKAYKPPNDSRQVGLIVSRISLALRTKP